MATTSPNVTSQKRELRALTEYMTVLDRIGRVRGADNLFLVVSESGNEYLCDQTLGACECPDYEYRGNECKHLKRVAYATGERTIPPWVNPDDVDDSLGEHCAGEPRWAE